MPWQGGDDSAPTEAIAEAAVNTTDGAPADGAGVPPANSTADVATRGASTTVAIDASADGAATTTLSGTPAEGTPTTTPSATPADGTPTTALSGTPADNTPTTALSGTPGGASGEKAGGPGAPRHIRRANPFSAAKRAGHSTSAWAKRPSGRLIVPAAIVILLLAGAGTAGAYLVPQAIEAAPSPSATPAFGPDGELGPLPAPSASLPAGAIPGSGATVPSDLTPTATIPPAQTGVTGATGARPADVLSGWAEQVGTRAGIPVVAVQAYGYAELVVGRTMPSCHLSWTTIAAIGKVESSHGSYKNSVLGADGSVQPPIYGLPLDGKGGRQLIRDTDQGSIDQDTTYDRAVGPLQFIPSTWLAYKVDADNNGVADPNDIDDASLAAANYLCQGGRDMSKPDSWWDAILSYNAVQPYAQKVFEAANQYGQLSRG